MTQPLFIVSLPRSGSTLLQKILTAHRDIASAAEPWILLPFWGMRDPHNGRAVYSHHTAANAINDFIACQPSGEDVFYSAISKYAQCLYDNAAQGSRYFLDKTPRYYLLLQRLPQMFPDAKIILLIRNPLAVLASLCKTYYKGRFMWPDYWIDWDEGHACLSMTIAALPENIEIVHYEELVTHPAKVTRRLCERLGIRFQETVLTAYRNIDFNGRMGDPTGIKQYDAVDTKSVEKWQQFFGTPFRQTIAHKMLDRIGDEHLTRLGYPRPTINAMIEEAPLTKSTDFKGRVEWSIGRMAAFLDYRYWQARYRGWRLNWNYTYGYIRRF